MFNYIYTIRIKFTTMFNNHLRTVRFTRCGTILICRSQNYVVGTFLHTYLHRKCYVMTYQSINTTLFLGSVFDLDPDPHGSASFWEPSSASNTIMIRIRI
jgi:hypothetical protein